MDCHDPHRMNLNDFGDPMSLFIKGKEQVNIALVKIQKLYQMDWHKTHFYDSQTMNPDEFDFSSAHSSHH